MWPSSDTSSSRSTDFISTDICRSRSDLPNAESLVPNIRCKYFSENARNWWKVDILLNALSALNSPVVVECVSSTGSASPVAYVVDQNKIVIDSSSFLTPFSYRRALARGLVYAFDNARAKVDYSNIDHLTCTSIRAANISGECDLWAKWTEYIGEDPLGMKMYSMKQRCVRGKVSEQILMESRIHSAQEIEGALDRVWERCFRDHWPFTTEPHLDTRFRESPIVRNS